MWKREQEELRRIEPAKPPVDDDYKLIALKSLIPDTGELRGVLSIKEQEWYDSGGYQMMEDEVIRWATKKKAGSIKLTFSTSSHLSKMEVGMAQATNPANNAYSDPGSAWSWDQSWQDSLVEADWNGDADALGKGKAAVKGMGKGIGKFGYNQNFGGKDNKGKGKTLTGGKGPYYGTCKICKLIGHHEDYCPSQGNGFLGKCNTCGIQGHIAKFCPNGKGKGKGTINSVEDGTIEEPDEENGDLDLCSGVGWAICSVIDEELMIMSIEEQLDPDQEWEKVEMTVDSGSVDTVGPPTIGVGIPINPTKASKAGRNYTAANGTKIKNLGEKKLQALSAEFDQLSIHMQVGETVNKFLGSVAKISATGNSVVFHPPVMRVSSIIGSRGN